MYKLKNTYKSSQIIKKFNEKVFRKYIGNDFEVTFDLAENEPNLLICGNHLQDANQNSIICGSGYKLINSKANEKPKKIFLQRGPYTKELLKKQFLNNSGKCGDPGILFSNIYPADIPKGFVTKSKNYKFGIIVNENEERDSKINFYRKNYGGKIISLSLNPKIFSEYLQNCEFVISTSLEGIIFAHSYKIPAVWIELSKDHVGNNFEFYDYFGNYGIKPIDVFKANLWEKEYSLKNLKSNASYYFKGEMVEDILDSFSEVKKFIADKKNNIKQNIVIPLFSTNIENQISSKKSSIINFDAPELILEKPKLSIIEKQPSVSICTVTFNRPDFLKIAEEFVKAQDYPHHLLEWIIVDDSDENNSYKPSISTNIKIYYERLPIKITIGEKRNISHKLCNGDIVVYFDDDDYYPPSRVSTAVKSLLKTNKLIGGSTLLPVLYLSGFETWVAGPFGKNHATAATFAFKKELLKHTRYDDSCKCGEEKEFLKGYKIPMEQLDPFKTVIAIAHSNNTYGKEQMRRNPRKYKMKKFTNKYLEEILKNLKPLYKKYLNKNEND
ncbi:MAG: hypothetical protein CMF96_01795 [Candidatus Marinimicrobia bacterium]|nr:hypothetical protein [Candidatus Neomarinimicrobiota bacterium]